MTKPRNILIAVDGSANAGRAVDKVVELADSGLVAVVHLVNVQRSIPNAVGTFVGKKAVAGYHHDEGMKALTPQVAKLQAAKLPSHVHIGVGSPGDIISDFCKELACDSIVMGTRGLGGTVGLLLGSVTRDVIAKATVPVTLVK